jgi:membrane-associated phospholipid phosphatase
VRNQVTPRVQPALARLALLVVGYVAVLGLVYLLTVRTVTGRELADFSLRGAIAVRPLLDGTVEQILDVVSVASLLATVAVVTAIALVRLAVLPGLVAIGILAGSNVSTWLLKNVLLTRPDLGLSEVAPATLNSLPSGHATAAFSAVAALLFVTWRRWRDVTATVGAGYAALTGVAAMLAGWHRAADSVAAFLVVGAWAGVGAAVLAVAGTPTRGRTGPEPRPRPVRRLTRSALASLVIAAALAAVMALVSPAPGNVVGSAVAFLAGCLFVVGGAAAVTVGVLESLRIADEGLAGRATER